MSGSAHQEQGARARRPTSSGSTSASTSGTERATRSAASGRALTGFDDANGDGIIDATEFTVADTPEFLGNALPTKELSVNTAFTFLNGHVRLGGQVDYRGGHLVDNSIENFRCTPVLNCRGPGGPHRAAREQARARRCSTSAPTSSRSWSRAGSSSCERSRSRSSLPDRWARAFRAGQMSLTFAGRNLGTITDYSGVDPEVNAFGQDNFSSSDFESQPQVRTTPRGSTSASDRGTRP